jgi:hypothetical protein
MNLGSSARYTAMRNEKLSNLDPLVGDWTMEASVGGQPTGRSRAVFEWAEDGAFLVQHARGEQPDFEPPPEWVANNPLPLVTILGLDEHSGAYSMLYADARGVFRVYSMTLRDGAWEMRGRAGPDFYQRFTATFSEDAKTIAGAWESSRDGAHWERDFDVTYRKAV